MFSLYNRSWGHWSNFDQYSTIVNFLTCDCGSITSSLSSLQAVKLSNEVYQLVPLSGYAYETIRVITSKEELEELSTRLINLAEMELASRVTAGAMFRQKEMHPAEYIYRSIGATLRLMNPDEIETQYLLKYIKTGMEADST